MNAEDLTTELEDARKAAANLLEDLDAEREKLAVAKAKDEAMFASIGDGLIAVDNDRKVTVVNQAAVDMLGWKREELVGRVLTDLPLEDKAGNSIPLEKRPTTRALATGGALKVSYYSVRKDKTRFPIAITATPIMLDGKITGLIEIIRDITREQALDNEKDEFISIASHQMRTPLTGIQWVVERFTKKEKLTTKGKEYLEDIHTSAKQLTGLVDLLLNLSRIESGRMGITPEPLEVIGFIKDFLGETIPLRDKKGLKISFEDHPAELAVVTDKSAIRNIVQSIISNAIEYTEAGGSIDIAVTKNDRTFTIAVRDTGIGIPRAEQPHIFEKFVRASNAKLYKTDGTGIGLYIAAQAVDRLGGKIWFESEEKKGSLFHVELPLKFISNDPPKAGNAVM
jgi:PAS domain S-box-containing protein